MIIQSLNTVINSLIDLPQIEEKKSIYTILYPIEIGHLNLISKPFSEFNAYQTFILDAIDSNYTLDEISLAINVPALSIKTALNSLVKTKILDEHNGVYSYNEKSLYLKKIGKCINDINNNNTYYLNCFSETFEKTEFNSLYAPEQLCTKSFGEIYKLPQKTSIYEISLINKDIFSSVLENSSSIYENLDDDIKTELRNFILRVNPIISHEKMYLPQKCKKYPTYIETGGEGPLLFEGHVKHFSISYIKEDKEQQTDIWFDLTHGTFYSSIVTAKEKKESAFKMPLLYTSPENDICSRLDVDLDIEKENIKIKTISEGVYYVRCKIEDII